MVFDLPIELSARGGRGSSLRSYESDFRIPQQLHLGGHQLISLLFTAPIITHHTSPLVKYNEQTTK